MSDPLKIDSTQIDLKRVKIFRWTTTASSKKIVIMNLVQLQRYRLSKFDFNKYKMYINKKKKLELEYKTQFLLIPSRFYWLLP